MSVKDSKIANRMHIRLMAELERAKRIMPNEGAANAMSRLRKLLEEAAWAADEVASELLPEEEQDDEID